MKELTADEACYIYLLCWHDHRSPLEVARTTFAGRISRTTVAKIKHRQQWWKATRPLWGAFGEEQEFRRRLRSREQQATRIRGRITVEMPGEVWTLPLWKVAAAWMDATLADDVERWQPVLDAIVAGQHQDDLRHFVTQMEWEQFATLGRRTLRPETRGALLRQATVAIHPPDALDAAA